jgi:pimeloyl-ACP methyl ester carboxylesterase
MLSALVSDTIEDRTLPVLVFHHGWHQQAADAADKGAEIAKAGFAVIMPDMRGRGMSQGMPDASGYELQDSVDALDWAGKHFARKAGTPGPYVGGMSGGGGNTYSMAGHFPYRFAAAMALCGMSDYALWYEKDAAGSFRDEMDAWIGGPPSKFPLRYRNRSGLFLLTNLRMPLYVFHGSEDESVPSEHAHKVNERRDDERFGGLAEVTILTKVGHNIPPEHWLPALKAFPERHPLGLLPGKTELYTVAGYLDLGFLRVDLGTMDASARLELSHDKDGHPQLIIAQTGGSAPVVHISANMGKDVTCEVQPGETIAQHMENGVAHVYISNWADGIGIRILGGKLP